MTRLRTRLVVALVLGTALAGERGSVSTQSLPPQFGSRALTVATSTQAEIRAWDSELTRLEREGNARLVREREDTLIPGRRHERFAQYFNGVPIFGAQVTRQSDGTGVVSLFGTVYRDIDIATTPRLSGADARDLMLARPEAQSAIGEPELYLLPQENTLTLAYRVVTMFQQDILVSFVDALNGQILMEFSDLQAQTIGTGTGVLGDTKKMSTESAAGTFRASDGARPPAILTYDLKGNVVRVNDVLAGRATLGVADLAVDSDNDWSDGAVVDAHAQAGWTYDYYFKRFGRRGLDNNDLALRSIVHPVRREDFSIPFYNQNSRYFTNAFWNPTLRVMVYGVGLPTNVTLSGQRWNFLSGSLDVVAHELTHGVTQFSSGLIYQGEAGALNEAFSDIMGVSADFFHAATRGRPANYLLGEEVVTPGGLRSMSDPGAFNDPDHYTRRVLGAADSGFVHTNSGIPNHVFYLAIEGGRNRTSGLTVQGVGPSNREQIEKVFYRAFTLLMPPNANFYMARLVTIQSARDLYGANSGAERAVTEAWDAVGVRQQTSANIQFLFAASGNPVPPAPAGACTLPAPNFLFAVAAAEMSGVALNVSSSQIRFYNAAGTLSSSQALSFAQLFNGCGPGSNRIPAIGFSCTPALCVSFGGATGGLVDFVISGVDDAGNQGTFTSPRLRMGTTTVTSDVPVQGSLMNVRGQ